MHALSVRAPFHALRSGAMAITMVSLAAAAHVFAGGELPSAPVLLAVIALTGLATTLATRFKLGFLAVGTLLGASQFALHEAFTAFSPINVTAPAAEGHHSSGEHLLSGLEAGEAHLHELDTPLSWLMLGGHVLATAASALLLAWGEKALWQLEAWLRPLFQLIRLVFRPDAGSAPRVLGSPDVFVPQPWRNLRQDSRRGPPAVVVLP